MLLLKRDRDFQGVLNGAFTPLVILPASPDEPRDTSKARANELAVDARIAGLGVTVVESKAAELFVLASDNESQAVGFARLQVEQSKTANPWFLLLRNKKGPLLLETVDRLREERPLTETGFVLPTHAVEIVAAYVPAQRNTAWMHSLGHYVGEHL